MTAGDRFSRMRHLRWAKEIAPRAPFSLGVSGMAAPTYGDAPYLRVEPLLGFRGSDGDPSLRQAIAEREGVTEDHVLLGGGTSGVNFLLSAALLEPGDEVLVELPGYEPLWKVPAAVGARVRPLPRPPPASGCSPLAAPDRLPGSGAC